MDKLFSDFIGNCLTTALPPQEFVPGESYITSSGMILSLEDRMAMIEQVFTRNGGIAARNVARDFEYDLSKYIGVTSTVLTNSGSSANLLALAALFAPELGSRVLQAGDEVITCAVGFPTTVAPIVQLGLMPVFIDAEYGTYVPLPSVIEAAITEQTRVIFLAHTLGNPLDVLRIQEIADSYNLWVIYDSCDALGAKVRGKSVAEYGDISTYSFYPAHHITMGEGGAVATSNPMLSKIIRSLRDWGRSCHCLPGQDNSCKARFAHKNVDLPDGYDHKYVYQRLGYNLKPTDIQAALGASQLKRADEFHETRIHNWGRLLKGLYKYHRYFILPKSTLESDPAWFGFCLTVKPFAGFTRDELVAFLESKNIATRPLFGGNLIRHPAFDDVTYQVFGDLYNADNIMKSTFWVGVWQGITDEMIDYMLAAFHEFMTGRNKR